MSNPYDSTLKELLEDAPESWPILVGRPGGAATVVNADIGIVTGAADKVIHVSGPPAWILHVEAQAGPDASLPMRAHVYNVVLSQRHGLPVHTVLLLLQRKACLKAINGLHEVGLPGQEPFLRFRHQVIRMWKEPPERFLAGGPGTAPLAMICAVSQDSLRPMVREMKRRVRATGNVGREKRLLMAAYILGGLCYPVNLMDQFLEEVKDMKESSTWQAIKATGLVEGEAQGELKASRKMLLALGRTHLGEPTPAALAALNAETSVSRLLEVSRTLLNATSWDELFPPTTSGPSARRHKPRDS